jgi:membrane protein YdbS with pleckstrin-like domain
MPTCPNCRRELGWRQSFSFWNPWNFPCPHCEVTLEASRIQKYIAIAVVPVGMLLAGVTTYFQKRGIWQTSESLLFFALVVPPLVAGALVSWRHTQFTIKNSAE